jgi:hypothetical protein
LRISVCDDWGRVKLAFDLEVVQLKTKQLGIRKKRVKGDTWHYKKYCEDVIRSADICYSGYAGSSIPNATPTHSNTQSHQSRINHHNNNNNHQADYQNTNTSPTFYQTNHRNPIAQSN